MNAPEITRFVTAATAYRDWIFQGKDEGPKAAFQALNHITRLYSAALQLPRNSDSGDSPSPTITDEERRAISNAGKRLPLQYYGEVFNPLSVPPDEPSLGDLADDLLDIYGDVVQGLKLYESGFPEAALWQWNFGLRYHWGQHATSAIRALHCWLAKNTNEFAIC